MKKSRVLALGLTAALSVSLLAGCGTGDTQTTPAPEGSTPVETGTTGAANELNVCFASEPETMDPSMNRTVDGNVMITHLFEGLYKWVDSDPSGDGRNGATAVLEPGMAAEEPTVTPNEDGTYTYTFKLREDAKWSDGQPVTANDFVYSWRRLVDPATASPYNTIIAMVKNANEIIAGELPKEELGVAAPDEHTFEVTLTYNCPYFLDICAFPNCMPLREDIVEGNATWTQDPSTYVTNGAFKMASWTHDAEIVMVPNENYYDASSITLEKLTFKLMDDANAQLTAFKNGDLDYMQNPPPDEMATLLTDGTVIPGDYLGSYYACFNNTKEPFNDPKVRQAINYALNQQEIIDVVLEGRGQVANSVMNVNIPGYSEEITGYSQDLEKAKALMAEAGYPDGFKTTLFASGDVRNREAQIIQAQLLEIGIEVDIQLYEWGAFLDAINKGEHDMFISSWSNATMDPDASIFPLFHTKNFGATGNRAFYSNPEVDTLIEQAQKESDNAKRMELYKEIQQKINDDAPWACLFYGTTCTGIRADLKGFVLHPSSANHYENLYYEK